LTFLGGFTAVIAEYPDLFYLSVRRRTLYHSAIAVQIIKQFLLKGK